MHVRLLPGSEAQQVAAGDDVFQPCQRSLVSSGQAPDQGLVPGLEGADAARELDAATTLGQGDRQLVL